MTKDRPLVVLAAALLATVALNLSAQTNVLERSVIGSGGVPGASVSHGLNGTVGQAVQGVGTSTSSKGHWGFWYGLQGAMLPSWWGPGWHEVAKVPGLLPVKDGAWLTMAQAATDGPEVIYAAKGNKSTDFQCYDPLVGTEGTWYTLAAINPDEGGREKFPKKGCTGVSDGSSYIYMTKGNNTSGFWRYSISGNTWDKLADVPLGADGKKVKGGTDLAYVQAGDTGWVYLLKGYKTSFYRYNTKTLVWDSTLPDVPYGVAPKYNAGSFLVHDPENHCLYAHQAKYNDGTNHYMFRFDLNALAWQTAPLKGMPVMGQTGGRLKAKKSKDGGCGVFGPGGWDIYALKGGNTQSFYGYSTGSNAWTELDSMPGWGTTGRKKYVKAGGDIASYAPGVVFALKGNKTYEFWRYVKPGAQAQAQARSGVMAGVERTAYGVVRVEPNPLSSGWATLRYTLPKPGLVSVRMYDALGRMVVSRAYCVQRMASSVPLDLRGLSAGVYLVRLDADGFTQSQKLVVQR